MKKLRWAMDGGFWEVDVSTPLTVDGVARPVPGDILPLGLSRGPRLSRPKQIDFFQRFMAMPFVPSFSDGLSFQRLQSIPVPSFARDNWFLSLLGQFNVQKFVTSLRRNESDVPSLQSIWKQLSDSNLYALNFCSELWLTPEDTLLFAIETQDDDSTLRKKAIFQHKFPHHNLNIEATTPALFVDHVGNYWNVPFTLAMDLASVASDTGTSCHFCVNHAAGMPKLHKSQEMSSVPPTLLPDLCAKCAVSFKNNFYIWRSEEPKIRKVQPYDIFLSSPHLSASTILGTVVTGSLTDDSLKSVDIKDHPNGFQIKGANTVLLADIFASASLSAQLGNFQRRFLDLTRINIRFDIPSGSKFLSGASQMANDLLKSQIPSADTVQAICPSASLSFQQQIGGPFSFRVDTGVSLDLNKEWCVHLKDPVCAVEYALKVLGSAKAVAWYSMKRREFMIELRFFET